MFEIIAIVTQVGISEPLELRLNHPFETSAQCEEFKGGKEFKSYKDQLESGKLFPNIPKEEFSSKFKFSYECRTE